jgi:hypothetical protein
VHCNRSCNYALSMPRGYPLGCLLKVLFVDDVIAVQHAARLMAGHEHRNALAQHVAYGCSPQIMKYLPLWFPITRTSISVVLTFLVAA